MYTEWFLNVLQPRPQGAFPWLWRWGPTSKAREERPGDEVEMRLRPELSNITRVKRTKNWN